MAEHVWYVGETVYVNGHKGTIKRILTLVSCPFIVEFLEPMDGWRLFPFSAEELSL